MSAVYPVAADAVRTTVASYTLGSGQITLASVVGFPTPSSSAPILVTVVRLGTYGTYPETFCTYRATGLSTNTLTGLTVIDGVDTAWVAGDIAEMRTCALHLNGPAIAVQTSIITEATETALPGSFRLTAGANITLTPATGVLTISAAASSPGGTNGQIQYANAGGFGGFTMSGDATLVTSTGVITVSAVGGKAVTLGGALTTSGANALTFTTTGTTNVTLPTSGTLSTTTGTVTTASIVSANGISGSVATATTTPAITLTLGAITPTSVVSKGSAVSSYSLNTTALPAPQTSTVVQIANADATATRLELDAFGSSSYFTAVAYGGTNAAPTAVAAATELGGFNAWAYNGSSVVGPRAALRCYANQNWTTGANGTYVDIATTPNGATAEVEVIRFENDGGVTVPSTVTGGDKGAGTINAGGLFVNGVQALTSKTTVFTSATLGVGNAIVAQGSTTYGTDQTTALQALITAAAGGILVIDGQYSITGSLAIPSNIWIIFPEGCGLIKQANSSGPMLYNAGMVSGGAMVSGARGVGGVQATALGNGTPATLSTTFLNTGIKITGGIFNGNGQNQSGLSAQWNSAFSFFCPLQFFGCDGVFLDNVTIYDPLIYSVWICNCQHFYINNSLWNLANRAAYTSGGPQFDGPCRFIDMRNNECLAYDDNLAFNADDGYAPVAAYGPFPFGGAITDVFVSGFRFLDSGQNHNGVRLLSCASLIDRVILEGFTGQIGAIGLQANQFMTPTNPPLFQSGVIGSGNWGQITCRDWACNVNASTAGLNFLDNAGVFNIAGNSGSFVFQNCRMYGPTVAQPLVYVNSRYSNWSPESILIDSCEYIDNTGTTGSIFRSDGRTKHVQISKCQSSKAAGLATAASPIVNLTAANSYLAADSMILDNCYTGNVSNMVAISAGRISYLKVGGYHHNSNGGYGVTVASGAVVDNFDTAGLVTDANGGTNYSNSGTITNNITTGGTFAIRSGIVNLWDGLQAYWRMAEAGSTSGTGSIVDQLGNFPLTPVISTTAGTNNVNSGNAAQFGGSQWYYSADTGANAGRLLNLANQIMPYTIMGWVKFSTFSAQQVIWSRGIGGVATNNFGFLLASTSGTLYCQCGGANSLTSSTISTGTWYHVAVICDPYGLSGSKKYYLYLNGVGQGGGANYVTPSAPSYTFPLVFGSLENNSTLPLLGTALLDAWGLWGAVLSGNQVALAYNGGTGIYVI